MKTKTVYLIQTFLAIIYLSAAPLFYSNDLQFFYDLKLLIIYSSSILLFLISIFYYRIFKKDYLLTYNTFKLESQLIFVAVFMMIISLFINLEDMNFMISKGGFYTNIFKGAGPNYLSVFFYFISFISIATAIVILKYVHIRAIYISIIISLIIVGFVILYQIFINDFLGRGQDYLFGWGNSNYTPDPFSIAGLFLLVPVFLKKEINYLHLGIGIFFFEIVLLSSSRAAFFGLLISLIIISVILLKLKKTNLKRVLFFFGLAFVIFACSYFAFLELGFEKRLSDLVSLNTLVENENTYSLYNRFDLWYITMTIYTSNFYSVIFGIGHSVYTWDSESLHFLVSNAHNQYLDILLSSGIIVFTIFLTLFGRLFMYAIKLVKYDINNIILLACLIFISVKWMFNSLNASHSPYILMVFALIAYRYMIMRNDSVV